MNKTPNQGALVDAPDEALLIAYANGDIAAAQVLAVRLAPRIMARAIRMLQNHAEAEDVTQDALMRLWKIAPDWRQGEAQITTWLYRVVVNLCTDHLRKRRRGVALDTVAEPESGAPSVAQQMQDDTRMTALRDALADLPERQAQAVALRHLEELGNPEIAQIMDISVEAVESLIARGKRALAQSLAPRKAELGFENDEP